MNLITQCTYIFSSGIAQTTTLNYGSTTLIGCMVYGSIDPCIGHFVALEYYSGILNRTYLVLITDEMLCGAKIRGLLPAPVNVTVRWKDPYFYPKLNFLEKLMGLNPQSPEFLSLDQANFQIERNQIEHVEFSTEKKWGMGKVPYADRIILTILGEDTKELILLGTQDGEAVKSLLSQQPRQILGAS